MDGIHTTIGAGIHGIVRTIGTTTSGVLIGDTHGMVTIIMVVGTIAITQVGNLREGVLTL